MRKKYLFISLIFVLAVCATVEAYINRQPRLLASHRITAELPSGHLALPAAKPASHIRKVQTASRLSAIPILMYHHVGQAPTGADAVRLDLTVPVANFQAQVAWLKSQGYQSVSLEDLYLYSQNKFQMPKKPVIFTFDDGYQDVFTNAIPILKTYGYSGSFGIITQNPGTSQNGNSYASWQTIKQAAGQGEEIVSHTQNHFDGSDPKFTAAYIFQNLAGSLADIQKNTGITTDILIYPYGHYTPAYLTQAKRAGFVMGVTTYESDAVNLDNLMEVPRMRVHGAEDLHHFEDVLLHRLPTTTVTAAVR